MVVKIYTSPTCPYCSIAKQFLKKNKIEFEEIDVSENREAAMELAEKTGQLGVPALEINGKIIIGFNQNAIKEALKIK